MSDQTATVTVGGLEKKSSNPNAPYTLNTAEGVRFKVFDRDGIVSRLFGMIGQGIVVTYREETNTYVAQQGPKQGQEVTTTDRIVQSIMPVGAMPAAAPAAVPAPTAAPPQPHAPAASARPAQSDATAKDYSIWRQTAMKVAALVVSKGEEAAPLAAYVTVADDLVHYFQHGRLPDPLTESQHRMIEALCGDLDKLAPIDGGKWRDRVKALLRKQYGREIASMHNVRFEEGKRLIDWLQGEVNKRQAVSQPAPPPAPPADPVADAVANEFPGAVEERPTFASDDPEGIPF